MKSRYIREMKMIASQLRNPTGKRGEEMAKEMHGKNFFMTQSAIDLMQAKERDNILELGHGSAAHLAYLMGQAENIRYTGLEISDTMRKMAEQNNRQILGAGTKFETYDGLNIPMDSGVVDKVFTVNTIYFWSDPANLAAELYRVLTTKGRVVIGFAGREFMEKLPFTDFGFELYNSSKVIHLMEIAGFSVEKVVEKEEQVATPSGEAVTRPFSSISFLKN